MAMEQRVRWLGKWCLTGEAPDRKLTRYLHAQDFTSSALEWVWEAENQGRFCRLLSRLSDDHDEVVASPPEPVVPKVTASKVTEFFVRPQHGPGPTHGPLDSERDARFVVALLDGFNEDFAGSKWEAFMRTTVIEETRL